MTSSMTATTSLSTTTFIVTTAAYRKIHSIICYFSQNITLVDPYNDYTTECNRMISFLSEVLKNFDGKIKNSPEQ